MKKLILLFSLWLFSLFADAKCLYDINDTNASNILYDYILIENNWTSQFAREVFGLNKENVYAFFMI